MKSVRPLRRLLVLCAVVALAFGAIASSKHGIPRAKAQTITPRDVFVFHCALIPNQKLLTWDPLTSLSLLLGMALQVLVIVPRFGWTPSMRAIS